MGQIWDTIRHRLPVALLAAVAVSVVATVGVLVDAVIQLPQRAAADPVQFDPITAAEVFAAAVIVAAISYLAVVTNPRRAAESPTVQRINRRAAVILPVAVALLATTLGLLAVMSS